MDSLFQDVRVAMRARAIDVVRLASVRSPRLTAIGLACGLPLTLALPRAPPPVLYEVSLTDAIVLCGTVAVILAATVLACWLPARRAAKVDPVMALRCE
jgi:putative ABC transport system permease protein